jgi:hypothetical protein
MKAISSEESFSDSDSMKLDSFTTVSIVEEEE